MTHRTRVYHGCKEIPFELRSSFRVREYCISRIVLFAIVVSVTTSNTVPFFFSPHRGQGKTLADADGVFEVTRVYHGCMGQRLH